MKKSTIIWIVAAAVVAAILLGVLMFSVLSFGKRGAENIAQAATDRISKLMEGELGENLPEEIKAEVEKTLREEFGDNWKQEIRQELEEEFGNDWAKEFRRELEQEIPEDLLETIDKTLGKDWMKELLQDEILEEVLDPEEHTKGYITLDAGENVRLRPEEVQEIQIDWVAGSIQVRAEDVTAIKFEESESDSPMAYRLKNGKLEILFQDGLHSILKSGKVDLKKDLTVTVPRDWAGTKLEIMNVSANTDLSGLTVEDISYEGVSGNLTAEGCRAKEFEGDTVSGNVELCGEFRELELQSVSGKCFVTASGEPEEISVNSVSGPVDLTLPEDAGFTLEFESLSGKLHSDFEATQDGKKHVCGSGGCEMEVETVSGDVKLHKSRK